MKRARPLAMALAVLFLFSWVAVARAQQTPREILSLRPSRDSEVILDSVTVIHDVGKSLTLIATGSHRVGEEPVHYRISVDLDNGTYTTRKLPEVPAELRDDSFGVQATTGEWTAEMTLATLDPIEIIVASTKHILTWNGNDTGQPTVKTRDKQCFARTSIDWHVDSCQFDGGVTIPAPGTIRSKTLSSFHNYSFNDPNRPTYVTHRTQITANNYGSWGYYYESTKSGDFYFLLHDEVYFGPHGPIGQIP